MFRIGIIIASDKGSAGQREDKSGPVVIAILKEQPNIEIVEYKILPDEKKLIKNELIRFTDELNLDLVITSGGTGVSPRDVTPDATLEILDKIIPGVAEAMRMEGFKKTPYAMISRAVAGIRGKSLIINLPGSPKAVEENLRVVLPVLSHLIEKIKGNGDDCGE
ncbi:MAG: MogA/MoaB family molybdenum cofactor biosynthesis protein [bacterium]